MDWQEKNALAERAFGQTKFTTSSGHARSDCPFCLNRVGKEDRKQCFAVHAATGWFKCWRCGITGRINVPDMIVEEAMAPTPEVKMGPPDGFCELESDRYRTALCVDEAREYLRSRGLGDPKLWAAARIGCCLDGRYAGRVVVPVLSPEGEWWGWVARVWQKKGGDRPYLNAKGMVLEEGVYNHAALLKETDRPVLVVEGVFDALTFWPDAVAVLGKPKEDQIYALAAARRPVAVVLDGDAWREGEALAMRLQMEGARAGAVRLPPEKDPDEVPKDWLWQEVEACL